MNHPLIRSGKTLRLSIVLLGVTSVAAMTMSTGSALAKNENNNGNHGNSGNHSNGSGKSEKAAKADGHPSTLGALNAAHASANALLHANPNSRVGRIAAFRDAVLETGEIESDRDEAQAALDLLPEPTRTSEEVQADLDLADIALGDANDLIADLSDNDPIDQVAIDQAIDDRDAIAGQIEGLEGELADNAAYDEAADLLADLEEALAERPAIERETLEAAANKPVTDAVEAEVERLLGLN